MTDYGYIDQDDYVAVIADNERHHEQTLRRLRRDANQCEECGDDLGPKGLPFITLGIICDHCHKELFA